jgi:hypothetical protein
MVRRPYPSGRPDQLICAYNACHGNVGSDVQEVESALLAALRQWLESFEVECHNDLPVDTSSLDAAITALEKELDQISAQEARIYDFVEQGIYSPEVFLSRSKAITERRDKVNEQLQELNVQRTKLLELHQSRADLIPNIRHVLDVYPAASPAQKNALLKSVLEKVEYTKTSRTRWKNGSDMRLVLYPRLPK